MEIGGNRDVHRSAGPGTRSDECSLSVAIQPVPVALVSRQQQFDLLHPLNVASFGHIDRAVSDRRAPAPFALGPTPSKNTASHIFHCELMPHARPKPLRLGDIVAQAKPRPSPVNVPRVGGDAVTVSVPELKGHAPLSDLRSRNCKLIHGHK
jgi:hypothetical protein